MSNPIVIVDTGSELLLFRNLEAAEGYLEPIDVENGEYAAAYNSRGQLLELGVEHAPVSHFLGLFRTTGERVIIQTRPEAPDHSSTLAHKVRTFLGQLGEPVPSDDTPLDLLLAQLRRRAGFAS